MHRFVQILCLFALASCAFGQIYRCSKDAVDQTITVPEPTFGCDGGGQRGSPLTWTIKASNSTRVLYFQDSNCKIGYSHTLTIKQGARILFDKKGSSQATDTCFIPVESPVVLTPDEDVKVIYGWPGSSADYPKFTIAVRKAPERFYFVQTGKDQQLPGFTAGAGWSYVAFQGFNGTFMSYLVSMFKYEGLSNPILYMHRDSLPTINRYIWTNSTKCTPTLTAQECSGYVEAADPGHGLFILGIYVTGPFSQMRVWPRWIFNGTALANGAKITKTSPTEDLYLINLPLTQVAKLNIKLARLPPGGTTTILIGQGFSPVAHVNWTLTVSETAHWAEVTIPTPVRWNVSNPGQYVIRVKGISAGSVFQATW